jgi:hypothetical protein
MWNAASIAFILGGGFVGLNTRTFIPLAHQENAPALGVFSKESLFLKIWYNELNHSKVKPL